MAMGIFNVILAVPWTVQWCLSFAAVKDGICNVWIVFLLTRRLRYALFSIVTGRDLDMFNMMF